MTIWGGCSLNYGLRGRRKKYEKEAKKGGREEEGVGRKWKRTDSFNEETPPSFASTQILSERISMEQGEKWQQRERRSFQR